MIARILDTSVAIAWYLPESFSAGARKWQQRMLEERVEFRVPSLHFWEFGNVLRTYVKRGELEAGLALEIYRLHLEAPLSIEEPNRTKVLSTALQFDATVYDAVYITLSRDQDTPLLTAERSTAPWIRKLGKLADCIR